MPTRDEDALTLARIHYELEAGISQIFRVTGPADLESRLNEPIKLLEVNEYTVPSGIMPVWFGPSPASGIYHPSVILEVTPEEYVSISDGRMELPDGWRIAGPIPRPVDAEIP